MSLYRADGFDGAIIGCCAKTGRLIYSVDKMLGILVANGMDMSDAREFFDYNIARGADYVGDGAPIFMEEYIEDIWDEVWGAE